MNAPKPSTVQPQLLSDADSVLQEVLKQVRCNPDRLSAILDESAHALIAFVADRTIVYANRAADEFFGVERHQLEGRSAELLLPQRLRTPGAPPQLVTDELTTVEVSALRADGSEVSTAWTFAAVPRPTSAPIFVMIVRARAQLLAEMAAMQRSDRRFRSLLVASTSIIWVRNAAGHVEELLPSWEEYTGQRWEDYEGMKWVSAMHPDDRARITSEWQDVVRENAEVYRTQGSIWSAKHNSWRAFQSRAICVRTPEGEVDGWVGSITDVQDAVEARARLRESEARYTVLFERTPTPKALTRVSDGELVAINQAFADLFELVRDGSGRPIIATEEKSNAVHELLREHSSLRSHECEFKTSSGRTLFVSLSFIPVEVNGVAHVLTTVSDISSRHGRRAAGAQPGRSSESRQRRILGDHESRASHATAVDSWLGRHAQ
jgi:PAS domain S-box-containing protein